MEQPNTRDQKVLEVCEILRSLPNKMTPKQFMLHYLTSPNPDLAYLRRYWAQPTGIESTVGFLEHLGSFIKRTPTGREAWKDFIQAEVSPSLLPIWNVPQDKK
jgi:hypothetical protein